MESFIAYQIVELPVDSHGIPAHELHCYRPALRTRLLRSLRRNMCVGSLGSSRNNRRGRVNETSSMIDRTSGNPGAFKA